MYLYIYDSFLSDQKYANALTKVEQRVTDLDIKGKIARLTILKNVRELIEDAVKDGVKTVVAIGDDQTFVKVINVVAELDVILGFIPITDDSKIAKILGIPPRELACDVLSGRIIKKIDLGKINNHYFMGSAEITNAEVSIKCNKFAIRPTTKFHRIDFRNFGGLKSPSDPTDGLLEAVITPIEAGFFRGQKALKSTVLPFTKITVKSLGEEPIPILTDEQVIMKTPAEIEIAPGILSVIVGAQRAF